jgi:hypothetical protein
MITKKDIVKYYIAMFDRIPEKEAVEHWYNQAVEYKWDEKDLVSSLFNTAVDIVNKDKSIQKIYPQYVDFNAKDLHSVINVVESIYKSLFDKSFSDDPDGIVNWTIKIITGETDIADAIISIEHFAEDVYDKKIDLKKLGYSDKDIEKIKNSVDIYHYRVDFAFKVSEALDKIKVNDDSLKLLQESVYMIHSSNDYIKADNFLEENLSKIVPADEINSVLNELNHIFINNDSHHNTDVNSLLESGENLGFIDLPMITPNLEEISDIHFF